MTLPTPGALGSCPCSIYVFLYLSLSIFIRGFGNFTLPGGPRLSVRPITLSQCIRALGNFIDPMYSNKPQELFDDASLNIIWSSLSICIMMNIRYAIQNDHKFSIKLKVFAQIVLAVQTLMTTKLKVFAQIVLALQTLMATKLSRSSKLDFEVFMI